MKWAVVSIILIYDVDSTFYSHAQRYDSLRKFNIAIENGSFINDLPSGYLT